MRSRFAAIAILICAFTGTLVAQNAVSTGAVSGIVTDPTGAVIPNVQIQLTNIQTGITQRSRTNSSGFYTYPTIPIGVYSMHFVAKGFKTGVVPAVTVSVGSTASIDVKLQVGASVQQVVVSAATLPLLNPSQTSVSGVVNQTLIHNLPLSGRNYTQFVLLTPNASEAGDFGDVSFAGQQASGDSGYGNGNGMTSFTVDGASATSSYFGGARGRTRVPYIFGEGSVEEFQVSDNPYNAAFGSGGAGFVNTVTKSGTNHMHGNLFYFNRNSGTASNDIIDKRNGVRTPKDILQQFGANLGGPMVKNRLFYFMDYEQQRQNNPISVINSGMKGLGLSDFSLPDGTALPAHDSSFPQPTPLVTPDNANASNPAYLQQVANALFAIQSNMGARKRQQNDLVLFPKVDWQATQKDHLTFVYNYNKFDAPGGEITFNPVSSESIQALSNNFVRDHHADIHWVHTFSPSFLNQMYISYLRDQQIETPSGLAPSPTFPTIYIFSPQFFMLGNPSFGTGNNRETEVEFEDDITMVFKRHTLTAGFNYNRDGVSDYFPGGFYGTYEFTSPKNFALMHPLIFSQSAGNPVFRFNVPFYGMYVNDKYKATHKLTLNLGLREDFQIFPQPKENPAIPLTGQFHNSYERVAPRLGFAWAPRSTMVVRGGFGLFYDILNGTNYQNSVISNGLPSQQSSLELFNGEPGFPTFPGKITNSSLFGASPNVSIVMPGFKPPYVIESSLEIQQALGHETSFSIGTMWTHAVHLISSSAYDLNLERPVGTTTYIVCPSGTPQTAGSCSGPAYTEPTLDNGLLTEGAIDPNAGQINALFSPGLDNYNSLFAKLTRRAQKGLQVLSAFTYSKNMDSNGVDFNNQFDLANTHSPSLLDQRIRVSLAAIYQPVVGNLSSHFARELASNWTISTVMSFGSGRPYTGTLNSACTGPNLNNCNGAGDTLNNSVANQTTGNTSGGISGAGPAPNRAYNSFYGPWTNEIDLGIERRFPLPVEGQYVSLTAQVFNLTNRQNFFVAAGGGVNQLQYNPVGNTCGDGISTTQLCYLIPNTQASGFTSTYFGELESINQLHPPRIWQFAFHYDF